MINTATNASLAEDSESAVQQESDEQEQEDLEIEDQDEEEIEEEEEEEEKEQPEHKTQQKLQKPRAVAQQMEKSGRDLDSRKERRPKSSITMKPIERYREVDNPTDQFLGPGQEASRMDTLIGTGALAPYTRKQLMKEYGRMQAVRNAFVIWQAQEDDYVIYQNVGWDEAKQKTRWKPVHYQLYPMTTGQRFKVTALQSKLDDLRRDVGNNDKTIKSGNKQIRETELELTKLKLETYFRMNVDFDPQTGERGEDDEFEGSSWMDVRDMIESAEWAFMYVPKSRRIKSSEGSGLADRDEETTKEDQSYGIR